MMQPRLYVPHETSTRKVGVIKSTCSRCSGLLERHRIGRQSYCLACHAEYMRMTRPKHSELKDDSRKKANTRAYTHVLIKRGKILKEGCEVCGSEAEAHHEDYNRPHEVKWFCRPHHLEFHRTQNGKTI